MMNKIIYTLLIFCGLFLVANATPKSMKSIAELSKEDTIKQVINDSLPFSKQTIDDQLTIISNMASAENLSKGQTIYEDNCGKCHKLYKPEKRNINAWMNVMKRMAPEANLSDKNYKLVCIYLKSKTTDKEIIKDSLDKEDVPFMPHGW